MTADRSMAELDERILELKVELCICEDWHHAGPEWEARDRAIRCEIHDLEAERDLLP